MKKIIIAALAIFSGISMRSLAQVSTLNPNAQPVINFDTVSRRADPIPFDKPFVLQIKGFPATPNLKIRVYKKYYKDGKRLFDNYNPATKLYTPEFIVPYTTGGGNLNMFFPAMKPNSVFDIAVFQDVNAAELKFYLKLNKAIHKNDPPEIGKAFKALQDKFVFKPLETGPLTFTFKTLQDYYIFYGTILPYYDAIIKPVPAKDYKTYAPPTLVQLKKGAASYSQNKAADNGLFALDPSDPLVVSKGLRSINSHPYTDNADDYDFDGRIANLDASIHLLDSVSRNIERFKLINPDTDLDNLDAALKKGISDLTANQNIIKDNYKQIKDKTTASDDVVSMTWLIGNAGSKDLQTLSGSILSTEFGLTNIFVKDNYNKTVYFPRLFIGMNIFFRQVDRDMKSRYLYRNRKQISKIFNDAAGTEKVNPDLVSQRTLAQHLSLSLGLTLGSLPDTHFDNFYNSFSLTAGPSYRFCRVLRLSAGPAFMKRDNPNPLLTTKPVAIGYYASFSVDFSFLKAANDFISLIAK